ncbi:MAG: carboxypeptidase-like regulatory domain-containing protein [Longimicrobiales bacterium]
MLLVCASVVTLGVGVPVSLRGQTLSGTVVDDSTDRPVAGVLLILHHRGVEVGQAISDSVGRFALRSEASGPHALQLVRLGFVPTTIPSLPLDPGNPLDVEIAMTPHAIELREGLTVSASRWETGLRRLGLTREQLSGRLFLGRALTEGAPRDIGAVLERGAIPGIELIRQENVVVGDIPICVRFRRANRVSGVERCAVLVLDDAVVTPHLVATLAPADLEAIVVLQPTEAAQRFGSAGGAGAVLLYTKGAGRQ